MHEQLVNSDNTEEIRELLQSIDDINAPSDDFEGDTPLTWAAINDCDKVAIALLQHPKLNPNTQVSNSNSALVWAAIFGHDKIVEALLQHPKLNPNAQVSNSNTALIWATLYGHDKIVTTLLQHPQINPNIQNKENYTALIWAAKYGHEQIVIALLQHRQTDPNYTDKYGNTALSIASNKGYKGIVSIIQNHLIRIKISEATIKQTARLVYRNRYGTNKADFFAGLPDVINIEIAALTGDPSVYTESQSREIAAASYRRINPQAFFSSPSKHSQAQQPLEHPQEELFNSEGWCSIL